MQLSIITINRNNEDGLRKTMTSVLSQTWDDFEYIIIDGASTDSSVDVIKKEINNYFKQDSFKVQYISEPDSGVFNAMNKGIIRANGTYLLFLNSGDFLIDNHVLNNVFCEEHDTDIVSCRCRVTTNGEEIFLTSPPKEYTFGFFYNNSMAHQATFIKKSLFDQFGLYREDLKFMGDWEFWLRTIILGDATTRNLDIVLSDYNLDGISSVESNQNLILEEKTTVFEGCSLKYFVPDYERFYKDKAQKEVIQWAFSKTIFRLPIQCIYTMSQKKSGLFNFIYRAFRKIYRIFFPPLNQQELIRRKQIADYKFLISNGVETELGYVTLFGEPIISKINNSRIVMGKGVVIISDSKYNRSGINHPTIIATEAAGAEIIIGDGVGMSGSSIVAVERIEIGSDTMLGANTNVYETDFHCVDANLRLTQKNILEAGHAPIIIGEKCWLASNITVLKGVTIGDRAVIGAMSLVCKDIPKDSISAGVPAKIISINQQPFRNN